MDVLQAIKIAIEESGETRAAIARRAGMAESQLSRLMSNERGLRIEAAERLAGALGLEIVVRPKARKRR